MLPQDTIKYILSTHLGLVSPALDLSRKMKSGHIYFLTLYEFLSFAKDLMNKCTHIHQISRNTLRI